MQTLKQKRALRRVAKAVSSKPRTGDAVRLTYGEVGVITGPGPRAGTYLVQVGSSRPMPYSPSQFDRVS